MKDNSKPQKHKEKLNPDVGEIILNSEEDKKIDKAKAELKILKKFIVEDHEKHDKTGKEVK